MTIHRTTTLMSSNHMLASLRQTQQKLMRTSEQLTTFKQVNRTSDAPSSTSAILLLHRLSERRTQQERNLSHASAVLDNIDQSLGEVSNVLLDAVSIASSQIGIGSTAETRKNQAGIIDAQITALKDIANRQVQGISLFGGDALANSAGEVFVSFLGGIKYIGSTTNLTGDVGASSPLAFNSHGGESFGAISARVQGDVDLDPQATAATRLSDVNGAQGDGVRPGSILVQVNTSAVVVDLASADTLGDVATRINAAIAQIDPSAGALAVAGHGFALTAGAGHSITLGAVGSSQTAADLGLTIHATGATADGGDVDPRLTAQTTLASLGAAVDWSGGLKLTQGDITKVADFSSATTLQDVIHAVDALDLGISLSINAQGTGLDLTSAVSGLDWSVGENAGGSTATDLGVRSFAMSTLLSDFNHGIGVAVQPGEPDFAVELHSGASFEVNLDGAHNVADVVNAIRSAAQAQGLSVGDPGDTGTQFNIGLAADGNGLAMEDHTAGTADFRVVQLGLSLAATDLGIYANAEAGNAIQGQDVATVRVESVMTHLMALRDALLADDSRGITFAGDALEGDQQAVIQARADVAVRAQRSQTLLNRSKEEGLMDESALSLLQDVDMTKAISMFSALQTQLQASLQIGAQTMQGTLMDYLR